MANNRLYLVDRQRGERICLLKTMADGWYLHPDEQQLNEWLDGRDLGAAYGCDGETIFELRTENQE